MMAERVWVLTVQVPMIVLAVDQQDAEREAVDALYDQLCVSGVDGLTTTEPAVVLPGARLPKPWDMGCIPWGEAHDRSIREILALEAEA